MKCCKDFVKVERGEREIESKGVGVMGEVVEQTVQVRMDEVVPVNEFWAGGGSR